MTTTPTKAQLEADTTVDAEDLAHDDPMDPFRKSNMEIPRTEFIDHDAIVVGTPVSFSVDGHSGRGVVTRRIDAFDMPEANKGPGYDIVIGTDAHWCYASQVVDVHLPDPMDVVRLFEALAAEGRTGAAWGVQVPADVMRALAADEELNARYAKACKALGL